MDINKFLSIENKCFNDVLKYDYQLLDHYVYKIPKNIKILIGDHLYPSTVISIYNMLKHYLIMDCCNLIVQQILQLYMTNYKLYNIVY